MKILNQYLYAIGRKLPYNARNEIIQELKSLLMDNIEDTYGPEPTPEEVASLIESYGSPREVANRYKEDHLVIGAGYTDLYFFIGKIIALALTISFSILFVIELFSGNFLVNFGASEDLSGTVNLFNYDLTSFNNIIIGLAKVIGRILVGTINGIGWLTIIFIILTRINNDQAINLDEDWTSAQLKDIKVGPEGESRFESGITIFFLLAFTVIINTFPGLVSVAEVAFSASGLLEHTINLSLFRLYLIPISILWLTEVIYHVFNLFYGSQSKGLAAFKLIIDAVGTLIMVLMFLDMNLYLDYTGLVGFRTIFAIISVINIIELIGGIRNFIKFYVLNHTSF